MQIGADGVRRGVRAYVSKLDGSEDFITLRVHLGLCENGYYRLNRQSSLTDGLSIKNLTAGQTLIVDVAGKQVLTAKLAPKPFTLDGLECHTAFFHSVNSRTNRMLLIAGLEKIFRVSAQTVLMTPVDREQVLEIVKQGHCSVNLWVKPNSKNAEAISVNFR